MSRSEFAAGVVVVSIGEGATISEITCGKCLSKFECSGAGTRLQVVEATVTEFRGDFSVTAN